MERTRHDKDGGDLKERVRWKVTFDLAAPFCRSRSGKLLRSQRYFSVGPESPLTRTLVLDNQSPGTRLLVTHIIGVGVDVSLGPLASNYATPSVAVADAAYARTGTRTELHSDRHPDGYSGRVGGVRRGPSGGHVGPGARWGGDGK